MKNSMINPVYSAAANRYENGMKYRRCGNSGILLPEISLGLWHNFGDTAPLSRSRDMLLHAFDHGICHFDLANNYGPSCLLKIIHGILEMPHFNKNPAALQRGTCMIRLQVGQSGIIVYSPGI